LPRSEHKERNHVSYLLPVPVRIEFCEHVEEQRKDQKQLNEVCYAVRLQYIMTFGGAYSIPNF
jgi:hypothetical protein